MIKSLPPFCLAHQYEELANKHWSKWRFCSIRDTSLILSFDTGIHASFKDAKGREWMRIQGNKITIRRGYAWNGCSPKRCILGIWFGTPDTERNILASMIHDALCQFFLTQHFPFSKGEVDLIFYHIMRELKFALACQYYYAVKKLGDYRKINGEYSEEINQYEMDFIPAFS